MSRTRLRGFSRSDTTRAEAFSDGVLAIAVTLLALGLADPRTGRAASAAPCWPSGPPTWAISPRSATSR